MMFLLSLPLSKRRWVLNNRLFEKIKEILTSGRTGSLLKQTLFINIAFFAGIWLGVKIFFPDDFILSRINKVLFVKDMGLTADDVGISILGNISFTDGTITEKGVKVITFHKLEFSPSLFDLLNGNISGELSISDVNNQGGEMTVSFETSEEPCYVMEADELPLSLFQSFFKDISFTGTVSGDGDICLSEGRKINGKVDIKGTDVVFRGKVPTPMGDFDVGKIDLGRVELFATVEDNKAEIEKFVIKGILFLDIVGKIVLNAKMTASSRIDLDVRGEVPDMQRVSENAALNLLLGQLSPYKGEKENSYAFMLRGFLTKPVMSKAPRERSEKGVNSEKTEAGSKRGDRKRKPSVDRKRPERVVPSDNPENEKKSPFSMSRSGNGNLKEEPREEPKEEPKEEPREEQKEEPKESVIEEPKPVQAVEETVKEVEKLPVQEEEEEKPSHVERKKKKEESHDGEINDED
jgi:type II secretion system protein N